MRLDLLHLARSIRRSPASAAAAAIRGRTVEPDDVGRPVAIVTSAFWRGKLAGDPNVIGRRIVLGARTHTIVGVLPDSFTFAINACDIWRPIPLAPARAARTGY